MAQDMAYQPLVLVDTAQLARPEWLEYRRKGLGGSDAAAVLNISPFRTARDLYYDKLGIITADDQENWVALEVGNLLEPLVARIFAEKTKLKIYQRKCMFQHPHYPWMLADLDYLVELPDGTTAILEIKTTNYNAKDKWWYNGEEIVPVYYETQGRHYMAVMNIDRMYFACLYGNNENEFFIRYMERDLDIEEDLIAEEEFFWKENVEKGVEPPYTEKPDLVLESIRKHCGPADKDAEQVKLGRKHLGSILKYMELKEQKARHDSEAKKLEEKMKEAYAEIVEEMGVSCTGVIKDGGTEYVVSYNPAYRTGIDKKGLERLKAQHPDVYDDYVSTTESRRFSVKMKGAA